MSKLSGMKPTKKHRLIDLVQAVGIDVSDWANYKGGARRAASNPKYCYKWSFVEAEEFVVLNLWHDCLKEQDETVLYENNYRNVAQLCIERSEHNRTIRAKDMDSAIQMAYKDKLPVRVIICDGVRRGKANPTVNSKVKKRELDTKLWRVTEYNYDTGACAIVRTE